MLIMKKNLIIIVSFGFLFAETKAQNIPRPNIPAPKGFSVNSFTGNVFYQRTDITLRGVGFPLYGTFYYNAVQDSSDYGYGKGWSFYYNVFYKELNDTLIIQHSDAKKDTFRLVNGAYRAPVGVYDTLIKSGNIFTLRTKEGIEQIFGDPVHKKLTGMNNRNGNTVSVVYTGVYPTRIRNASGRCFLLTWLNDHLTEISDSSLPSKKYAYLYNNYNELVAVTNPLNKKKEYAYTNNNIVRHIDENNNPVLFVFYPGGRIKQINSCNSEQLFTYIDTLRQTYTSINNSAGNSVTSYQFDEKGRLKEITTPDNKKATFTYDAQNNITKVQQPGNHTTDFIYSTNGNLTKETDAIGFNTEYTYNSLSKVTTLKDKRGNSSSFSYNAQGDLTGITKPGNITETFTYNTQGQLLSSINGNGNTTTYEYNANGDLTKIQSPVGAMLFEYGGGCCNLSKITDANGNSIFMTYDLMNRLTSIKDDLNNTTVYEYDAGGNLIKETDPNGNIKRYGYDASDRLISVQIPVGTWQYEYDGAGNFINMKDAKGNSYLYEYDINNQLVKETDPLGNSTTYKYDDNGNPIEKKEPLGNAIIYKYDEEDRLIERTYPGNSDKYSYDANGNMVAAFNNNIVYSFEYDALDRLIRKVIPTWNKTIAYTYDSVGNRRTMTDPDGGVNYYMYDANNRLVSLTNQANLATTFIYDAGGRLTRQNNANSTYATYTYDTGGRVDSILHRRNNGDTIAHNFYSFDQFGNRLTMKDKYGLHVYSYDGAQRLTGIIYGGGGTENFTMDANGNRTIRTKNNITTNYTYNNADQIITAGTNNYSFDANGNTISNTETGFARTFSYDGLNRLTEVQVTANKNWQTKYDPFGEKIETVDTANTLSRMLYDGENLLGELNNANAFTIKYTTALGTDSWLTQQQGSNTYFYHRDGLNSTSALTGAAGNIVNEYKYDVYGNILTSSGSLSNLVTYTGRIWQKDLSYYDYRSRIYNPGVGRFINRDDFEGYLTKPGSFNKYSYVENSPTCNIDYSGNFLLNVTMSVVQYIIYAKDRSWHIKRNIYNEKPVGNAVDAIKNGWKLEPRWKNSFHQNEQKDRDKYVKINKNGSSSEAIWDPHRNNGKGSWLDCGEDGGPSFNYVNPSDHLDLNWAGHIYYDMLPGIGNSNYYCPPPPPPGSQDSIPPQHPTDEFNIPIIRAKDPNEIIGPIGYDSLMKWVSIKATLPYKILFENDPEFATGPAQKVIVYCPIHTNINPNSLRLGDFGFGSFNFSVPANSSFYNNRLDVRDSLGVFVDVTSGLDITNRRAFWIFESIDPATGLAATLPANIGFLPVNDSITHRGEGYVNFTVIPNSNAHTRDSINHQASIVFDSNETIPTNIASNIIDAVAPTSSINPISSTVPPAFTFSWSGNDDPTGSGIRSYDLYVSKNSGPFVLELANIDSNSHYFVGEPGSSYNFYIRATDHTGNKEADKPGGDKMVTVIGAGNSICPGANTYYAMPRPGNNYTYHWQVDSTGTGYIDLISNSFHSGVNMDTLTLHTPPTSYYGFKYRCIAINGSDTVYGVAHILKFSVTWQGNISSAWENPGNWNCNYVADGYTDVIIPGALVNNPIISNNAAVRSILISSGSVLSVSSGKRLDIKGK
jgi:RHS repeat-associated protein